MDHLRRRGGGDHRVRGLRWRPSAMSGSLGIGGSSTCPGQPGQPAARRRDESRAHPQIHCDWYDHANPCKSFDAPAPNSFMLTQAVIDNADGQPRLHHRAREQDMQRSDRQRHVPSGSKASPRRRSRLSRASRSGPAVASRWYGRAIHQQSLRLPARLHDARQRRAIERR